MSRNLDDLPWRLSWRVRRVLLALMGPPQLSGENDPVVRLDREKAERRARQGRMDP